MRKATCSEVRPRLLTLLVSSFKTWWLQTPRILQGLLWSWSNICRKNSAPVMCTNFASWSGLLPVMIESWKGCVRNGNHMRSQVFGWVKWVVSILSTLLGRTGIVFQAIITNEIWDTSGCWVSQTGYSVGPASRWYFIQIWQVCCVCQAAKSRTTRSQNGLKMLADH